MVASDFFGPDDYIKGRYLIRDKAELSGFLEHAFTLEALEDDNWPETYFTQHEDGFHLAVFLYPNERCDGLIPIIRLGAEEGTYIAPLDAQYISMLSESVVLPKALPREFPYQTESLMSYLKNAIANGELEADWERTSNLIDRCPLWTVDT